MRSRAKYGNKKVEYQGISFDSKREMQRYIVLKEAERKGEISDLELQPKFELVPAIKEKYVKHLKTKDKECERTVQFPITYIADFRYIKDGNTVVEDVKASKYMLPKEFTIKAKLMRYVHGVAVRCVYKANEPI